MNDKGVAFNQRAKNIAFDEDHRLKMNARYNFFRIIADGNTDKYSDFELEKTRAFNIRKKTFDNLDKYLVDFDTNFTNNGGKILWAKDSSEARQFVYNILSKNNVEKVVKSKSNTAEEIGLKQYLEMKKIAVVETNVGDFICGLENERPYDIHLSACHKTKEEIAELFAEKFGVRENLSSSQLVKCSRRLLDDDMLNAKAVVTGANFLLSDTGSIVLTENEGNILKSLSCTPIHIVIAGIDKVLASIEDLSVMLPLSSIYNAGNNIASSYTLVSGPSEIDGNFQDVYVILLNNGRTDVMAKERQRSVLYCVQCGACSSACPIFNAVGGHVYENPYPGPIGSVLMPIVKGQDEAAHFSTLCTSCGRCSEVCPMDIPLKDLILENRKDMIKDDKSLIGEKHLFNFLKKRTESRKSLDSHPSIKNFEFRQLMKKSWGTKRETPSFAEKSFSQIWKENNV